MICPPDPKSPFSEATWIHNTAQRQLHKTAYQLLPCSHQTTIWFIDLLCRLANKCTPSSPWKGRTSVNPHYIQLKRQTAKDKMRQDQRKHNPTLRTNGRYIILAWYSNVRSSQAACHTSFCICSAVFGRTRLSFSVNLMHWQASLDYQKVKTGDCLLILPFTVKNVTAFRKAMCRAWKVGRHAI